MAAADVSQFLWKKFLSSLVDAKSELSGSMNLFSYFEAIKHMQTLIFLSSTTHWQSAESCLANECRELNKKILVFNASAIYFVLKMKRQLTILKRKFVTLVSNAMERKESNNVVECLGLLTEAIVAVKKNSEEIVVLSDATQASFEKVQSLLVGGEAGIGFTTVGIVGMAGVGKSTFVRNMFENQRVSSEYSPIVWLCLSEIIPEKQLVDTTAMEESVNINIVTCLLKKLDDEEVETGISGIGLNLLLERLNHLLSGKRYLIVLDDVRHINNFFSDLGNDTFPVVVGEKSWDRLSHGLPKDSGGAVIVTSRTIEVAQDMVGLHQHAMNKRLTTLKRKDSGGKEEFGQLVVLPDASTWKIDELLFREASGDGFTAIGIVGMAGMGKSSMVLEVLNFYRVWSEFSPIVWLQLSDIIPVKQVVLDSFGLKPSLIRQKVFDCVDDVWHTMEFYSDLGYKLQEGEKFGVRLSHGLPKDCGGAVIIMSRITEVAQDMVGKNNVFIAKPWDRGWCWMQFRSFITRKAERCGEEKRFSMSNWETVQKIENEILDQICGLPSIAKALAELIVDKRISETDVKGSALKEMLIPREFLIHRSFIFVPLNQEQVIAVLDESFVNRQKVRTEEPEKVLKEFYGILEKLKSEEHRFADEIKKKMTIIIVDENGQLAYPHEDENHISSRNTILFALFHQVHETDMDNPTLIYGGFWNYFSLGVDDPRLYGASRFRHTSSIRSIVCLNLPSFLGGLTPWTTANMKKDQTRGLTSSFIDDGCLDIIGSKDDLLSQKKRWIRLDQVQEIHFKFIEDSATVVNMMFDGVPWKRAPLDGLLEIGISYHCQVNVLVKQDHSAKSIHDSSQTLWASRLMMIRLKSTLKAIRSLGQQAALKYRRMTLIAERYSEEPEKFCEASTSEIPIMMTVLKIDNLKDHKSLL
ncbi:hypothetical protein M0R45_032508 [Rubus argutus]|uniref:NB-ARC domain-containing protein n=1 Tax=Rubus argutus TaxID=59490 RepID=A0AAW1WHE8_RUBAR